MIEIAKKIYWVGIRDWDLKKFHGHEFSTHRGSTYNSYLIKDKKTVLVDTVWDPYKEVFAEKLDAAVGLGNIDMIVINHMEPDHGGSLGYIMSKMPEDVPIYCTRNGIESINGHFPGNNWNLNAVKTGDTVNIGEYDLVFVEMRMLHWPDSLLTYVKGAGAVLSNDAFGQHYSARALFNDQVDRCELYQEAIKYYAKILAPFSALVKRKIEEIRGLNLDIDIIAPSHGVIWRDNPAQIIDRYYEWSQNYAEDFVAIIYDTMYNSTKMMAEAIGRGLELEGTKYKIFNSSTADTSDLVTEIFKAKGIIVGSCTINNTCLRSVTTLLEEIEALRFKGKAAAAFGSYGWSGEAPGKIYQRLEKAGLEMVDRPLLAKYRPTAEDLNKCTELGRKFALHSSTAR